MDVAGAWYRAGTVDVENDSRIVVGHNTLWKTAVIAIAIGDMFTIDSKKWYEVVAVNGEGSITLNEDFEGATAAGVKYAIVRNTSGTILTRIAGQIAAQFAQKQVLLDEIRNWLSSDNETETITDSFGIPHQVDTPKHMADEHASRLAKIDSLTGSVLAMTKAEFFALAEERKRQCVGSGSDTTNMELSLEIAEIPTMPNRLRMLHQVKIVNGFRIEMPQHDVLFPSALDGLDKKDGSRHANLAAAIVNGGTGLKDSVLSRKDFLFPEIFAMPITKYDFVYPYGDTQFNQTEWEGIQLRNDIVPQGFSATGEHDSTTRGYGFVWSTATPTQRAKFIQAFKDNVYSDDGQLICICFRRRTTKGLGDDWNAINPITTSGAINYSTNNFLQPQGMLPEPTGLGLYESKSGNALYFGKAWANNNNTENGVYTAYKSGTQGVSYELAHDGLCFAIPIAMVQRRNFAMFHQELNPHGTGWGISNNGASGGAWYTSSAHAGADSPVSNVSQCFDYFDGSTNPTGRTSSKAQVVIGGSQIGRWDDKFVDGVYASDVEDLRVSSREIPLAELLANGRANAISGSLHGFEGVPFTVFPTITDTTLASNTYFSVTPEISNQMTVGQKVWIQESTGYVEREVLAVNPVDFQVTEGAERVNGNFLVIPLKRYHGSTEPSWTDIIGDPANIAAVFPEGVEGQWVPKIPDGISTYILNRKALGGSTDIATERTIDGGVTWNVFSGGEQNLNATNNSVSSGGVYQLNSVTLNHYKTQAHFTKDDVNSEVLVLGEVYASSHYEDPYGNGLLSSLINKVGTTNLINDFVNTPVEKHALIRGKLHSDWQLKHAPLDLAPTSKPTIKVLFYLSSENGVAKLMMLYKEVKYGNGWGDNNQFTVVDNQSTETDDNGNSTLIGTASVKLPYFVREK